MQLPETATLDEAGALLGALDSALAQAAGGVLRIDASGLKNFDTSTVALLLHARRAGKSKGMRVELTGAPPKLVELAQLYGVDELLSLEPT